MTRALKMNANLIKKQLTLILLSTGLSACHTPPHPIAKQATMVSSNAPPAWINGNVSTGAVCIQDRGIYSRLKAENIALNSCLIQLADKVISGDGSLKKSTQVTRNQQGEKVVTQVKANNHYQLTIPKGSKKIQYNIQGKYYDVRQQRVYIWVSLK